MAGSVSTPVSSSTTELAELYNGRSDKMLKVLQFLDESTQGLRFSQICDRMGTNGDNLLGVIDWLEKQGLTEKVHQGKVNVCMITDKGRARLHDLEEMGVEPAPEQLDEGADAGASANGVMFDRRFYECNYINCHESYATKAELERHVKEKHIAEISPAKSDRPYIPPYIPEKDTSTPSQETPLHSEGIDEKTEEDAKKVPGNFPCKFRCGKAFTTNQAKGSHERTCKKNPGSLRSMIKGTTHDEMEKSYLKLIESAGSNGMSFSTIWKHSKRQGLSDILSDMVEKGAISFTKGKSTGLGRYYAIAVDKATDVSPKQDEREYPSSTGTVPSDVSPKEEPAAEGFPCTFCPKVLPTRVGAAIHIRRVHGKRRLDQWKKTPKADADLSTKVHKCISTQPSAEESSPDAAKQCFTAKPQVGYKPDARNSEVYIAPPTVTPQAPRATLPAEASTPPISSVRELPPAPAVEGNFFVGITIPKALTIKVSSLSEMREKIARIREAFGGSLRGVKVKLGEDEQDGEDEKEGD